MEFREPYRGEDFQTILERSLRGCRELETRVKQLEKLVQYPNTAKQDMREAAAKAQANEHLYAPLRSDTAPLIRLAAFARRLLDPSDLGHAVTEEVRNLAREALGK